MTSAWSSFAISIFFLYVLGDLVFGWWTGAWWVWLIIGLFGLGAVSSTLRYIAYGFGATSHEADHYHENSDIQILENEEREDTSSNVRIIKSHQKEVKSCKYCGQSVTGPASFCPNCGAMVE